MADPARCITQPNLTPASLPGIGSFSVPGVKIGFDAKVCCKQLAFGASIPSTPPVAIPPLLLVGVVTVLNEIAGEAEKLIAQAVPRCPRS